MFKRKDIKPCHICEQGIDTMFYRVRIETFILDSGAIQRQAGLELMLNSPDLAQIMGPDEDLAQKTEESTVLVCLKCMTTKNLMEVI